MTVAQVLAQSAIAFWRENWQVGKGLYICRICKMSHRFTFLMCQPVNRLDAESLAEHCGKTHCDACGSQIAGKTEEK